MAQSLTALAPPAFTGRNPLRRFAARLAAFVVLVRDLSGDARPSDASLRRIGIDPSALR